MEMITIKGQPRTKIGTRESRRVRLLGELPSVIYGHKEPPEAVMFTRHDMELALKHGARMLQVELGGAVKPCLIKAVQYDHLFKHAIHVDLTRVDLNERVRVKVGIELRGIPKGVSEGGVLEQYLAEIDVECLVTEIPNTLHPAVGHLTLGQSLLIKDLVLPPGVEAVSSPTDRIASVRELVVAPVAEAPVEGAEAPAEPERIGRVRKDEPEEGEKK
ncbi:MAG: 50S ribosomal protein L25 [Planctomycetota bacterium]